MHTLNGPSLPAAHLQTSCHHYFRIPQPNDISAVILTLRVYALIGAGVGASTGMFPTCASPMSILESLAFVRTSLRFSFALFFFAVFATRFFCFTRSVLPFFQAEIVFLHLLKTI